METYVFTDAFLYDIGNSTQLSFPHKISYYSRQVACLCRTRLLTCRPIHHHFIWLRQHGP